MSYTGDKTDVTALVKYAQSLEAEIERLRAAVWAAIPWLDDLEHMGSIVDQDRRAATAAMLAAAVRTHEQKGGPSKEWCAEAARREGDSEVGAGGMIADEQGVSGQ